jgi:hypothetical protein
VYSEERISVAVPGTLMQQLHEIAEADGLTLSSTARRLLSRAVARECAQTRELLHARAEGA